MPFEVGGGFATLLQGGHIMTVLLAPIPVDTIRPGQVRSALFGAIHALDQNHSLYCVHPKRDFSRRCVLSFPRVIRTILGFGTSTVSGELSDQAALSDRADWIAQADASYRMPTKNAFIMRRQLIHPEAFRFLFHEFMSRFIRFKTLHNYRVFAADGSSVCIPSNLKDLKTLVQGKPGSDPYNQVGIEALYDVLNNTYEDFLVCDYDDFSEKNAFLTLAHRLKNPKSSIITADRFYGTLPIIAHLLSIGVHFVLRCKDIDSNGFASGYNLSNTNADGTFDLSFHKTLTYSRKKTDNPSRDCQFVSKKSFGLYDDKSPYYDLDFRLVRVDLGNGHFELLVTDLPRDVFSADDIADIYRQRWNVETSFRRLKHLMGTLFFHSYKHDSVLQEIYAKFIMYNYTALIASTVSIPDSPDKKQKRFVNFARAVLECRKFFFGRYSDHELRRLLRQDPCCVRPDRNVPRSHRPKTQPSEDFNWRAV